MMDKSTQGNEGREAMAKTKEERFKELEKINIHGSKEKPTPGTEAWAEQRGLK